MLYVEGYIRLYGIGVFAKAMWTLKSTQFHYLINKQSNVYLEKQFFQALRVCKYYAQIFFVRFYQHFHEIRPF